nr:DUF3841 domain-containing protein [uncultured Sellimonas sp.]
MDYRHQTITLFSSQADPVLHAIEKDGVCYSKAAYVRRKYGESSPIFLTAYDWYVRHAEALVPKPEHAEFPYWAFTDTYNVDTSAGGNILTLEVPIEEVVFFQVKDWNKILCLTLIGESEAEEDEFRQELSARGLHTTDIMLTSFYPEWKQKILNSWNRLFRFHEEMLQAGPEQIHDMQAGLWRIKKEWIRKPT